MEIEKKRVERIKIIFARAEQKQALEYCDARGYEIRAAGVSLSTPDRGYLIAYRELPDENAEAGE